MGILSWFIASPAGHSLVFGFLALFITMIFSKPLGHHLENFDGMFIGSVMLVTYIHGWRRNSIMKKVDAKLVSNTTKACPLDNVVSWSGNACLDDLHLVPEQVNVIVFFATYCKASRRCLKLTKDCVDSVVDESKVELPLVLLTQESDAELLEYEANGSGKAAFVSLKNLGIPVGIEDGLMYKRYQLQNNVSTYPHCYIVDRNMNIAWHGHPLGPLKENLRKAISTPAHRLKTNKVA